jgi:hypothetical protein
MEVSEMQETQETPTVEARERLTLRDAVRLSGMSEKTLRRKLEAGLLSGQRETLDYGGFMWMIDARSLADLYPDSAAVRDYVQYLEHSLQKNPATPRSAPPEGGERPNSPADASLEEELEDEPVAPARNDFVLYLLEENRELKEGLRDRERQLRSLQERALQLERECGEQRGTASTQARVLEWFQRQPLALALPSGEGESPAPPTTPSAAPALAPGLTKNWTAVTALLALVLSLVVMIKAF